MVAALVSGGRWGAWRDSVIPYLQGPVILELGPGPGHLLQQLQRRGMNGIGLDASPQMIRLARQNFLASNLTPPCLVRADGQRLPFQASSFTSVVATFPTSYIFLPTTLSGIERVLLPGGRLVVLISAWITDRSLVSRFLAWLFRITGQVLPDQVPHPDILAPLQAAGLDSRL